jgi:hypothetical protein
MIRQRLREAGREHAVVADGAVSQLGQRVVRIAGPDRGGRVVECVVVGVDGTAGEQAGAYEHRSRAETSVHAEMMAATRTAWNGCCEAVTP